MVAKHAPIKKIISIFELLKDSELAIPHYQRPYKWTSQNINQLFSDISAHKDKSFYRLGTVVFHHDGQVNNIVDGQQRTITLLLIVHALLKRHEKVPFVCPDLGLKLADLKSVMESRKFKFESEISKANIHANYLEILRVVTRDDFTEDRIQFLLSRCQVVTFSLNDISEAFQFFDSQNARGRDLDPHDLLKAFHLREFSRHDEALKATTVESWENSEAEKLALLFSRYLYRIRNWSKGESARYFGKNDIHIFKGVNLDAAEQYPYVAQLRMTHHFVDQYNQQYERKIDGQLMDFPFSIDQTIINGRRFFEMVSFYQRKVAMVSGGLNMPDAVFSPEKSVSAPNVFYVINSYSARLRAGDCYVRSIFDCMLVCYIDKFDFAEIDQAVVKIFIWAYSLRLKMQAVQLPTIDKYILENNLFKRIKEAVRPADFINISLPVVAKINSTKTEQIEKLFESLKYYKSEIL